ncbi:MAG: hypothetical protein Q4B08_07625 [Propionibacteriaceae bacterium]|nr:hypothetical protein [Propionibacteriaceae bacterium]
MIVDIPTEVGPKFRFRVGDNKKVWKLPSLNDLPIGIKHTLGAAIEPIQKAQQAGTKPTMDQLAALGNAQIALLDRYCPGLLDVASEKDLGRILQAWAQHSGIDVGESQASAL